MSHSLQDGGFFHLVMGIGRYEGFYELDKDPDYSLPFKAWGYFDLRGCELADGSQVGD
jgi:hypothetical protein